MGHVISRQGIATEPEKTSLIREWPTPRNLKELRGFLGICGYYRRFVEGFSEVASPLNALLRKGRVFAWTEKCQTAFEELKQKLQQPPILALPNDEGTFVVDTDASEGSIGAVLSQIQSGEERVICCGGRTLSPAERNYCITRKELLAVVHFLKLYRQYLLGRHFVVRTDHSALGWLRRTPEPIGQNARWAELLEEYDFTVEHRPGKRHANADSLSRHPCLNRPSCSACHRVSAVYAVTIVESKAEEPQDESTEPSVSEVYHGLTASVLRGGSADGSAIDRSLDRNALIAAQREDPEINFVIELKKRFDQRPDWKEVEG